MLQKGMTDQIVENRPRVDDVLDEDDGPVFDGEGDVLLNPGIPLFVTASLNVIT